MLQQYHYIINRATCLNRVLCSARQGYTDPSTATAACRPHVRVCVALDRRSKAEQDDVRQKGRRRGAGDRSTCRARVWWSIQYGCRTWEGRVRETGWICICLVRPLQQMGSPTARAEMRTTTGDDNSPAPLHTTAPVLEYNSSVL